MMRGEVVVLRLSRQLKAGWLTGQAYSFPLPVAAQVLSDLAIGTWVKLASVS